MRFDDIKTLIIFGTFLLLLGSHFGGCLARGGTVREIFSAACAGACERRGAEFSHIHENFCVCQNGHTLTMDLGGMYRELDR